MTQQLRVLGAWLAGLGFVWTGVAALASGQYVPNWFDPDDGPCAVDPEGVCAAGLHQQWWWVGVGGLLTLVGVALVVWSLDRAAADAPPRQLPGVAHALLAAALSPALFLLLTLPALFLLLVTGTSHGLVLVGLVAWLVEAPLLAALDQAVGEGGTSSRSRHAGALVVSGVAVGVTLAEQARDLGHLDAVQVLRHAAVVGLGVLLLRFLAVPGAARARLLGAVAGAAAVLAVGALVLAPVLHRPTADSAARREADPLPAPPSAAAPTPTATPVPAPVPVPEPTPTPTPTPVVADAPCAQQDLTFQVEGFDAAMGARAAALVATNTGSAPCWLEGVPVVVLMQGGRPLALQVGEGQTPEGGPARTERVGVAPGGTAVSLLSWRSYGGWADLDTPQSVTVALDASTTLVSAAVSGGGGAAPFDIADGGAWGIAPWAAPAG